ncbi:MAG: exonuclease domain-containing protein [Chitinophagaceae bacterium]
MSTYKFAIVDIETTGGHANKNGITEIAIVLFDGTEIEGSFTTLVNPQMPIQPYVQSMTGITNSMVALAPLFKDVAYQIHNLLQDRIFVAHNVNFDYSFVKHELQQAGFTIDLPKICTVRLARKVFPGLPKYGLGSLSKHFNIANSARHRAMGDAMATTTLLQLMLQKEIGVNEINKLSKRRKAAQYLPPNLSNGDISNFPSLPGVYYFHDKKGKIIYVGKAVNLKKRISSHFSNNKISKQKQDFLRDIYTISYEECSSDLMAEVLESIEIKRLWPKYNKSQKHGERKYGIYQFEDSLGYLRLAIDNKKKILKPLVQVNLLVEARNILRQWSEDLNIHPYLFFLSKEIPDEFPNVKLHNLAINDLVKQIKATQEDYLIHDGTGHYFYMEQSQFIGIAQLSKRQTKQSKSLIKEAITLHPTNNVATSLLVTYAQQFPETVIPVY